MGKHKIAVVPKDIASYLNLDNPKLYTGHSFRRSGATVAANAGIDMPTLQKLGGWLSPAMAQRYIDQSLNQKNKIAATIGNAISGRPASSSTITQKTPEVHPHSSATYAPRASTSHSEGPLPTKLRRLTPQLHPSSSGISKPRASTSHSEGPLPAKLRATPQLQAPASTTVRQKDQVLHEIQPQRPQTDSEQSIILQFTNCTGFNFFGSRDQENRK